MKSFQELTNTEIARRMAAAGQAKEHRSYREAALLYNQLGKDIQARCGKFDPRAIDAFEGVARTIRKGAETEAR